MGLSDTNLSVLLAQIQLFLELRNFALGHLNSLLQPFDFLDLLILFLRLRLGFFDGIPRLCIILFEELVEVECVSFQGFLGLGQGIFFLLRFCHQLEQVSFKQPVSFIAFK